MSNINFDNPYLLLIAVPLVVLFTIPFAIAIRKDNRNGHNIASMVMHIVLAGIIGLAAAGTTIDTVLTETDVYVVADVSYSTNKNLSTIDNIIKNRIELPANSKIGVVTFGKDYELLCDLGRQRDVKSVKKSKVDDSETNIAEALTYAGSLFREDVIKRIVLITDAKQTDEVNKSAMRLAVDQLERQHVKVDAYFLDSNSNSGKPEVQISSANFTESTFLRHEEIVSVTVESSRKNVTCKVALYKNGILSAFDVPTLSEGVNQVNLDLDTSVGGTFNYEIRLEELGNNDTSEYNNSYSFTQTVASELKVLMLTNSWDDCEPLIERYKNSATIDLYEYTELTTTDKIGFYAKYANDPKINIYCFDTSIDKDGAAEYGINIKAVPYITEELSLYDEIVLADFDARTLGGLGDRFMTGLNTVVSSYGKSLITLGNTYIQDETTNTVLQKLDGMLPVRFGRSDAAPKSYTIVIDQSFSLIQNDRFLVAKDAAKRLVGLLDDSCYVSVIAFWNEQYILQNVAPLTDPDTILARIDQLETKQGTSILAPLRTVYNEVLEVEKGLSGGFSDKQIMIITDGGDHNATERENAISFVSDIYNDGFVTSVYNMGWDLNDPNNGANSSKYGKYLRDLADAGHGNYFLNAPGKPLDEATFGEVAEIEGNKLFKQDANVVVNRVTDDVLEGLPTSGLPQVSWYITSSPRASATTVLQVEHKRENRKPINIPLFSYWTCGDGKVASFAGAFAGDWIRYWEEAGIDSIFFSNIMEVCTPNQKAAYPYRFEVTKNGSSTTVSLTPAESDLHYDAVVRIRITTPDGKSVDQTQRWQGSNFTYEFTSVEVGRYEITVDYSYGEYSYESKSYLNISYPNEYDEFATFEVSPLYRAINGRGQVVLSGKLKIENDKNDTGVYTQDLTFFLLLIAVALFLIDIVVRKLKWEDIVSFFGGFKKSRGEKS